MVNQIVNQIVNKKVNNFILWETMMGRWLKIWLIIWLSAFVVLWVWIWLTKKWIIPNWLNIEALNPCVYDFDFSTEVKKPVIYLYPTMETEVNVILWNLENLLHTYPKYNLTKWWDVIAQKNWDLEDMETWRKLYALYREWKSYDGSNFNEWFVVAWKDIISFLEEKLAILWLNEREAEEFIVYWLPQMENNEYNLIRFETMEEQNENMSLNISPKPDTIIRVMMDWKAVDEPINIPEQKLIMPERTWFTVVEWWWSLKN